MAAHLFLEDDGAVEEHGVDAGDLLQDGQHDADDEGLAEAGLEELAEGAGLFGDDLLDVGHGGGGVGGCP